MTRRLSTPLVRSGARAATLGLCFAGALALPACAADSAVPGGEGAPTGTVSSASVAATTYTIPAGVATLSYNATVTSHTVSCSIPVTEVVRDPSVRVERAPEPMAVTYAYTTSAYSGFEYTIGGVTTPLTGTAASLEDNIRPQGASGSGCNLPASRYPAATLTGTGVTLTFTPSGTTGGSVGFPAVPGYVNLRYLVLGVSYAPPGNQSYVQYGDTNLLGTSTTFSSSVANNAGVKVAVASTLGASFTLPDIGGTLGVSDTTTNTFSASFTDEEDTSSSVAISSQSSWSVKVLGPSSPYVGVDHDYDIVWVWLNPLLNFDAFTQSPSVTWTGYSYDANDVPEMDIVGVYLGWLNGHLVPSPSELTPLARTWASGQVWPVGTSPSLLNSTGTALDSTDAAAIAATDPFSNPSYTITVPSTPVGNRTSSDGRFTLTGNQVFNYEQPPLGGQPVTEQYAMTTTTTQTQGKTSKYTFQLGYAWENKFTATIQKSSWSSDVTLSDSLTFTEQWSTLNTEQTGVTATASITGPPCVVGSSTTACSPVYTGPAEYEAFQDNIYNTFVFYPH